MPAFRLKTRRFISNKMPWSRSAVQPIETAIRIMSRFRKEGWVHAEPGGYIVVTDFDRLQRFSEGV